MHCTGRPEAVGIVLAGGRSSRMGRDKADVEWRPGQTLLARAVALAEAAGCAHVIVSGNRPGYDHVVDRSPGAGPLGGIESVLAERRETLDGRLLLVVPLDMPMLTRATLTRLLEAGRASAQGAMHANGPLPMAVWCSEALHAAVHRVMSTGRKRSLGELASLAALDVLPQAPELEMANVNRRDELAELRRCAAGIPTD
jgi:molybdopterin-guanine dinucleotide biosynthesis protein A